MIPVDHLPDVKTPAEERATVGTPGGAVEYDGKLDGDEQVALEFLDSQIEPVAASFTGDMFGVPIAVDQASDRVIASLKKLWESGGWIVGVFQVEGGWQVIFARPRASIAPASKVTAQLEERDGQPPQCLFRHEQAMDTRPARQPRTSTPLLIRMPTRGRPEQALKVLAAYRAMQLTENVKIEVVVDEDDDTMLNAVVLQRLYDLDCVATVGNHRSKVEAVNGGRVDDWAVMALASDDMVPVAAGYDVSMLAAMEQHFPLLDGAVYFNDGYNKEHSRPGDPILCTMPVFGRHLYEQFGYVYEPSYKSLYCDNEQTRLFTAMKRIVFVDELIIEHRHHAAGKAPVDALYAHNDKLGNADKKVLESRAGIVRDYSQFAFDAPPMWLSILVCSTVKRAPMLGKLVEALRAQMRLYPREVELCVDVDDGEVSIGEKRQRLLQRAVGHFVAFIDDDDMVSHDYVERIVQALRSNPTVDCLSLVGVLTTNGEKPERFEHSLKHDRWYTRSDGVHIRTPNHLNATRRELAIKAGFPSKSFGEDHDFSKALKPLLKSEASTGDEPLYFYWFRSKKE